MTVQQQTRHTGHSEVLNQPVSGLWLWGLGTAAALVWVWGRAPACYKDLLPMTANGFHSTFPARASIASCAQDATIPGFLFSDVVLIVAYAIFFLECSRWGALCLGWAWARRCSRAAWRTVILLVLVDLAENVTIVAFRACKTPPWLGTLLIALEWGKTILAVLLLLMVAVVLLVGVRRFALPWTTPPRTAPRVDAGPIGNWPASEKENAPQCWFVSHDLTPYHWVGYGIGLSGGGIRAAAFCAGALQRLAGHPQLDVGKAAYLATVSGGGYLGVSTQVLRSQFDPQRRGYVVPEPSPYAQDAPETSWLRDRHRYLADNSRDRAQALVGYVIGVACNLGLVLTVLAAVGIAASYSPVRSEGNVGLGIVLPIALLAGAAYVWHRFGTAEASLDRVSHERDDSNAAAWRAGSAVVGVLGMFSALVWFPWWNRPVLTAVVIMAWALAGWVVRGRGRTSVRRLAVAQTCFIGGWVTLCLWVVYTVAQSWPGLGDALESAWWRALLAVMAAVGVSMVVADQTWWSPHPFYKERLASTFAVRRAGKDALPLRYDTWTYLDEWARKRDGGPELVVCATANLDNRSVPPARTRAVPFVFGAQAVGSPELGWWSTEDFRRILGRRLARDGTLQAATAISGAAVASALGAQGKIPTTGTALALLNARLGVWLPNPNQPEKWTGAGTWGWWRSFWRRTRRPHWLLAELLGWFPGSRRFVYVSDGGHLDNLGLLELLRRRCRVILLIDASGDKRGTTAALDEALALAHHHLKIEIDQRESPLTRSAPRGLHRLPASDTAEDCVELVKVTYPPDADGAVEVGWVILAKAAFAITLKGDDRLRDLCKSVGKRRWLRRWPWSMSSLPKASTANQFLTDAQFDGYVELGRAVGQRLCDWLEDTTGDSNDEKRKIRSALESLEEVPDPTTLPM